MTDANKQTSHLTEFEDNEAVRHFKQAIMSGKNWYLALLEAISMWNISEETIGGRRFCYVIGEEAFDWLLLAERLCRVANGLIPDEEMEQLLFHGKAPVNLTTEEFKNFIGAGKYKQYLSYFYGVTVEEALILAVEAEVVKERRAMVLHRDRDFSGEAYRRIYGAEEKDILREFRQQHKYPSKSSIGLSELREFTYWLFKYRLEHSDRSKVASDTKKAMEYLKEQYVKTLRSDK
ncbi:MAG: hypothetical protein JW967_07905 [Dehalococcoidales bacterium]|nr:hypothetical protein [Dehalococcoidales bacterium]